MDIIVVGAGSAGCVTARRCAELGLRTLLLEKKPEELVGKKVCGDEISKSHFDETGINYPRGDEISSVISGADVYPPNLKNELRVRGWTEFDGWTVDRLAFGQRLLAEAKSSGVMFRDKVHVGGPILHDDYVIGVSLKDLRTGEDEMIRSRLVIDASGFAATIRNKLDYPMIEKTIDKRDIALCYREILNLRIPLAEPEVARVILSGEYAPHGYAWIFPKGVQSVNAGIGISGGQGRGSPKALFEKFKEEYPLLYGSTLIEGGGGAVPVRRPLSNLVHNGVAFIGDAAWMVNPIHGGGLGPGMRAGIILGEIAKEAVARRNTSMNVLWGFNVRYLSGFGRRLASLEIFKRLLIDVSDEDMNFGFERRILEAGDLMAANRGAGLSIGLTEKLRRLGRGLGNIGLMLKIQKAAKLMKKIDRLYARYPFDPSGFEKWKRAVDDIIKSAVFT